MKGRDFILLTSMYCNMDREITAYPVMIRAAYYRSVAVPVLLKGKAEISAKILIF